MAYGSLGTFFSKIRDGQAPEKFTNQILKDLGFTSNNHRAFIPILKALGFLSADGVPTQRYHNYRSHALSREIMGQALKEAYSDLFLITSNPSNNDKDLINGKFKSFHNVSDNVAKHMTNTFYSLLSLADLDSKKIKKEEPIKSESNAETIIDPANNDLNKKFGELGLHYNIQIHLPATKDIEVYNAIFKSIKDHLIE
ncbi:MAG: hypothetical protein A2W85_06880 [Bacteroidetes bacterium GWF2_41_31]|nr:MAG: hypothetical protein A2W85_06880 [Bacteroidetes bacterium GWF2_41_31]